MASTDCGRRKTYTEVELVVGGKDKEVTEEILNKAEYLRLFTKHRLLDAVQPVQPKNNRVLFFESAHS